MSVNFEAKLSLDISQFLKDVQAAEASMQKLNGSTTGSSAAKNAASGLNIRKAQAAQEMALSDKLTRQEQNNAKVIWQSEMMNQKALDARLKDHETLSSSADRLLKKEADSRRAASDQIKRQMQDAASADIANKKSVESQIRNQARSRYALYDVSAAYQQMASVSVAALSSVATAAISYERAFADVARTTEFQSNKVGEAARIMRNDLLEISNELPVAFGQVTEIATIGNQLGIAQGQIADFTETVAKFSSTTDVTAENAAMAFGRIGQLLDVKDFNALGSAIAYAGVNAVATETQILATAKEIATTAKQAKFATPEVIGLSTALSSLGIAPEAARGSIIRSFAGINKAVSENGAVLEQYATLSGMTADQFASTWQRSGSEAFDALLRGLEAASNRGENLDTVLRDLGVKNVRDIQTLQKLGDNYGVYAQSIRDANMAFEEGVFLGQAYSVIQDTLAAKIQVVQNKWDNFLATIGSSTFETPAVKGLVDGISELLTLLQSAARNPAIQFTATLTVVMLGLVAAIATVNSVVALGKASMLAFAGSMTQLSTQALAASGSMAVLKVAASAAFAVFGRALLILGGITAATYAITALGDEIQKLTDYSGFAARKAEEMVGSFGGLQDAITMDSSSVLQAAEAAGMTADEYAKANGYLIVNTEAVSNNNSAISEAYENHNNLLTILGDTPEAFDDTSGAIESQTIYIGANTQAWVKNALSQSEAFQNLIKNKEAFTALQEGGFTLEGAMAAGAAGDAKYFDDIVEKYKATLSGLKAINPAHWGKLLDSKGAIDQINSIKNTFMGIFAVIPNLGTNLGSAVDYTQAIADNTALYEEQLNDADSAAGGLGASLRTVLDYSSDVMSVFDRIKGIKFDKQAGKDDIADGWAKIAESASDAEQAVKDANDEINSLAADKGILEYQLSVANRYGDEKRAAVIRAKLAGIDSKMSSAQDDLTDAQNSLTKGLKGNTQAARDNRDAVVGMVDKYQNYIKALIESGLKGEALQKAIDTLKGQFLAQGEAAGIAREDLIPYAETFDNFKEAVKTMPRKVDIEFKSNASAAEQAVNEYIGKLKSAAGTYTTKIALELPNPKTLTPIVSKNTEMAMGNAFMWGGLTAKQFYMSVYGIDLAKYEKFASGGFVSGPGSSTSDSIPAMLSNGEYVINAKAVGTYGLDFMNSLNKMKVGTSMPGAGVSAGASGGTQIAQLSPEDRALLRAVADRPVNLYADSTKIAQSANTGNTLIARRGTR